MTVNTRKLATLGKNIKKFRKNAELTQEQLASKIRTSSTYVGYIEQGKRNPSLKTLDKIARVLNTEMSALLP